MSDDPIRRFLRTRGVSERVVESGLEGLVGSWESLAETVESGYPLGWLDYLNDLDVRQIIEVVLRAVPEPNGPLLGRLRAADSRLRAATVPSGQCVVGQETPGSLTERRNWWYFSIPRNPGEELAEDLAREGLGAPPPPAG